MTKAPTTTTTIANTDEWLARLGEQLSDLRLARNLGQSELAARAGVGRSAVQNLEAGRGNLATLVRVVRALGREEWLQLLFAQSTINPLHLMPAKAKRQRASRKAHGSPPR
jgi:transcriptional regulator with XRE-family HTH domain